MAYAVKITGCNFRLLAPPGRDDVVDLECFRNQAGVVSRWELTDDEVEEILRTRTIFFHCLGNTHPPIWIGAESGMREFTADFGVLPRQEYA